MTARCTSNACRQGRDKCRTPEACRIPEGEDGRDELDGIMRDAALAFVVVVVVALTVALVAP